jgi:hypothetical protein
MSSIKAVRVLVCGAGRVKDQLAVSTAWGQLLKSAVPPVVRRLESKRPSGADLLIRCVFQTGRSVEVGVAVVDREALEGDCLGRLRQLQEVYSERAVVLLSAVALVTHAEAADKVLRLVRDGGWAGLRTPLIFHPSSDAEAAPWTILATACSIFTNPSTIRAVAGGGPAKPELGLAAVRDAMRIASTGPDGDEAALQAVARAAGSELAGLEAMSRSRSACVADGLESLLSAT